MFKWILIMLGSDFVFVMMVLLFVNLLFVFKIEFVWFELLLFFKVIIWSLILFIVIVL